MRGHGGKVLVGLVFTVVLLWWALSGVAFEELADNVRRGDPWLLGAAVAVATFGFLIRALRWEVLLRPLRAGTSLRSRFAAVAIHFMANNVLPLRVGEFARAWVFGRLEPVRASAAFGTVVVERFMDGVVLLAFLVLAVSSPGFPAADTLSTGWGAAIFRAAAGAVAVVLVALGVMVAMPRRFVRFAELVAPVLPRPLRDPLLHSLGSFLESLVILRHPGLLVLGLAWTVGFWSSQGVSFWLAMQAFGIDAGYVAAAFTLSVVAFGVSLPSAPGFFGTFHAAALFALTDVYGYSEAQSLAFAFGYHFGGWVPITLIGLYYVWSLGLSLSEVGASEDRLERPEAEAEAETAESAESGLAFGAGSGSGHAEP